MSLATYDYCHKFNAYAPKPSIETLNRTGENEGYNRDQEKSNAEIAFIAVWQPLVGKF
jgi:hypothetical protein